MSGSSQLPDTLKALLLDFQELRLDTGVPRRLNIAQVRGKATVCICIRRAGKLTYLYQQIQRLLDRGIARENLLYLNFFDDRLHDLRHTGAGLDPHLRIQTHQEYYNSVLRRDLVERRYVAHPRAATDLAHHLAVIVTRNTDETVEFAQGTIRVLPAWRFLLSLPDAGE